MTLQQRADEIIHRAVNVLREPRMVKICSWCPDARERTREAHEAGIEVTHSICPSCEMEVEADAEERGR